MKQKDRVKFLWLIKMQNQPKLLPRQGPQRVPTWEEETQLTKPLTYQPHPI